MQGSVCVYDVAIDILADGAVDREFLIMLNIFLMHFGCMYLDVLVCILFFASCSL